MREDEELVENVPLPSVSSIMTWCGWTVSSMMILTDVSFTEVWDVLFKCSLR